MLADIFITWGCRPVIIRIHTEVVPQLMWCSKVSVQENVITLYMVTGLGSYEVNNCEQLFSSEKTEGPRRETLKKAQYLLNISSGLSSSGRTGFLGIS